MQNYITIEKIWQENDFFEAKITCASEIITATAMTYVSNENIDELFKKIRDFIDGNVNECLWENGSKGDDSTTYILFKIFSQR